MYRAYKIDVNKELRELLNKSQSGIGLKESESKNSMETKLSCMVNKSSLAEETLDADSIWDEWFPEIKADVFISHSSKDAELAKLFANWLKQKFSLTAFIDSEIWGHCDTLLKNLDTKYCLNEGKETYDYDQRNGSTAHVHMLLSYALTRMIDQTECFVFLGSHNSVTAKDSVDKTYSPWIFHELAMVDTIEQRMPSRYKKIIASKMSDIQTESFSLNIKYPILGRRLIEIKSDCLSEWESSKTNKLEPLDVLYDISSQN